jgi:hypothetical protein
MHPVPVPDPYASPRTGLLERGTATSLIVGLLLALLLTAAPPLRFMGWILRSLFHETGHVAAAWLSGCPAFPVIDLRGHAAAIHQPHRLAISLLVGALVGWCCLWAWRSGRLRAAATTLAALWLVVTLALPVRETLFLLAGHLGELLFAWVFLRRARTGEGVEVGGERPLYACLGFYLVGSNVVLCLGLLFVPAVRAAYETNGSFGMENDLLRTAREGVRIGLAGSAVLLALLAAAVLGAGLRASRRAR